MIGLLSFAPTHLASSMVLVLTSTGRVPETLVHIPLGARPQNGWGQMERHIKNSLGWEHSRLVMALVSLSLFFSQLIFLGLLSFHDDHPESPLPFRAKVLGDFLAGTIRGWACTVSSFCYGDPPSSPSLHCSTFFLLSILQKPCPLFKIAPKPFSLKRCRVCFWVRWDAPMAPLLAGGTVTSSTKLSKKNNNINIWGFYFPGYRCIQPVSEKKQPQSCYKPRQRRSSQQLWSQDARRAHTIFITWLIILSMGLEGRKEEKRGVESVGSGDGSGSGFESDKWFLFRPKRLS